VIGLAIWTLLAIFTLPTAQEDRDPSNQSKFYVFSPQKLTTTHNKSPNNPKPPVRVQEIPTINNSSRNKQRPMGEANQ
jgi:hypothetical protein